MGFLICLIDETRAIFLRPTAKLSYYCKNSFEDMEIECLFEEDEEEDDILSEGNERLLLSVA